MNPLTKFQKMRARRADAQNRSLVRGVNAAIEEQRRFYEAARAPEPLPSAVLTMEIDGVRYREERDNDSDHDGCVGCAFQDTLGAYRCLDVEPVARKAFGGECAERRVIYLRADTQ